MGKKRKPFSAELNTGRSRGEEQRLKTSQGIESSHCGKDSGSLDAGTAFLQVEKAMLLRLYLQLLRRRERGSRAFDQDSESPKFSVISGFTNPSHLTLLCSALVLWSWSLTLQAQPLPVCQTALHPEQTTSSLLREKAQRNLLTTPGFASQTVYTSPTALQGKALSQPQLWFTLEID